MQIEMIEIQGKKALGVVIELGKAPIVFIRADLGFMMCGFLDISVANNIGETCAKVRGVASLDEILEKKVVEVSEEAMKLGVRQGMSGKEALLRMFR